MRSTMRLAGLLLASVVAVWPVSWGGQVGYVITHGISMEPRFHTGDLALIHPERTYHVGEVVAYHNRMLHTVVLHRIVAISGDSYTFKGDNNSWLDAERPTRSQLIGALVLRVPRGGVWLHRLTGPPMLGMLAFACVAAGSCASPQKEETDVTSRGKSPSTTEDATSRRPSRRARHRRSNRGGGHHRRPDRCRMDAADDSHPAAENPTNPDDDDVLQRRRPTFTRVRRHRRHLAPAGVPQRLRHDHTARALQRSTRPTADRRAAQHARRLDLHDQPRADIELQHRLLQRPGAGAPERTRRARAGRGPRHRASGHARHHHRHPDSDRRHRSRLRASVSPHALVACVDGGRPDPAVRGRCRGGHSDDAGARRR